MPDEPFLAEYAWPQYVSRFKAQMLGFRGKKMPGMQVVDDEGLMQLVAMFDSLSMDERIEPLLLLHADSRLARIARGSGMPQKSVAEFVDVFLQVYSSITRMWLQTRRMSCPENRF